MLKKKLLSHLLRSKLMRQSARRQLAESSSPNKPVPKDEPASKLHSIALLLFPMLLLGCAASSPTLPPSPPVIKRAPLPPLPSEARQSPAPAWCQPSCTEALTKRRLNSLSRSTAPSTAASGASSSTTPSASK